MKQTIQKYKTEKSCSFLNPFPYAEVLNNNNVLGVLL